MPAHCSLAGEDNFMTEFWAKVTMHLTISDACELSLVSKHKNRVVNKAWSYLKKEKMIPYILMPLGKFIKEKDAFLRYVMVKDELKFFKQKLKAMEFCSVNSSFPSKTNFLFDEEMGLLKNVATVQSFLTKIDSRVDALKKAKAQALEEACRLDEWRALKIKEFRLIRKSGNKTGDEAMQMLAQFYDMHFAKNNIGMMMGFRDTEMRRLDMVNAMPDKIREVNEMLIKMGSKGAKRFKRRQLLSEWPDMYKPPYVHSIDDWVQLTEEMAKEGDFQACLDLLRIWLYGRDHFPRNIEKAREFLYSTKLFDSCVNGLPAHMFEKLLQYSRPYNGYGAGLEGIVGQNLRESFWLLVEWSLKKLRDNNQHEPFIVSYLVLESTRINREQAKGLMMTLSRATIEGLPNRFNGTMHPPQQALFKGIIDECLSEKPAEVVVAEPENLEDTDMVIPDEWQTFALLLDQQPINVSEVISLLKKSGDIRTAFLTWHKMRFMAMDDSYIKPVEAYLRELKCDFYKLKPLFSSIPNPKRNPSYERYGPFLPRLALLMEHMPSRLK